MTLSADTSIGLRFGDLSAELNPPARVWWQRICCALAFLSFIGAGRVFAQDIETYLATSINASQGEATLFSHEPVLLGLSCKSGPIAKMSGLSTVNIGDTLAHGKYSFRVGIIEVSRYKKDVRSGGTTYARAGDVICALAANRRTLPYEDDCDALWVRIVNCQPIR